MKKLFVGLVVLVAISRNSVLADVTNIASVSDDDLISIATGHQQPIYLAPSVATAITRKDIERIGATTVCDALELVAGFHCLYRYQGSHYIIRGLQSRSNFAPDVLVLIDGIPYNDVNMGNQRQFISAIPMLSVERIEVLRGPGAALYGADAFAGVVNIITRKPDQTMPNQLELRGGSYHTGEAAVVGGFHSGEWHSLLSLQLRRTDGHEPFVEQDAQTTFDQMLGTSASRAPGNASSDFAEAIAMYDLQNGPWQLRLRTRTHNAGMGAGFVSALDPQGEANSKQYDVDIFYNSPNYSENAGVRGYVSYFDYDLSTNDIQFYPPGAFGGLFPDGVVDSPEFSERRLRVEITTFNTRWGDHQPSAGIGAERAEVYDVRERRNYQLTAGGIPFPLGSAISLSDDQEFTKTAARNLGYVFAQDEWNFAPDWALTAGVRIDHYTDFGTTTNPRVAVVWSPRLDTTTKMLAGSAFRAPTFIELYAQNNPSTLGNPDLDPVTIRTYEWSTDYHPNSRFNARLSLFSHSIDDVISYEPTAGGNVAGNTDGQDGKGYEIELRYEPTRMVEVAMWYAYQHNEVRDADYDLGFGPRRKLMVDATIRPTTQWTLTTLLRSVVDQQYGVKDNTDPAGDYSMVDLIIGYQPSVFDGRVGLTVRNLFDRDGEASDRSSAGNIELPGRNAYLDLRLNF